MVGLVLGLERQCRKCTAKMFFGTNEMLVAIVGEMNWSRWSLTRLSWHYNENPLDFQIKDHTKTLKNGTSDEDFTTVFTTDSEKY